MLVCSGGIIAVVVVVVVVDLDRSEGLRRELEG